MLVVSDTSPLSNLAIIGRLELLRAQFNEVTMPPAVTRELAMLGDTVAQFVLSKARRASFWGTDWKCGPWRRWVNEEHPIEVLSLVSPISALFA